MVRIKCTHVFIHKYSEPPGITNKHRKECCRVGIRAVIGQDDGIEIIPPSFIIMFSVR